MRIKIQNDESLRSKNVNLLVVTPENSPFEFGRRQYSHEDTSISRKHVLFTYIDGNWCIEHIGMNHTFICRNEQWYQLQRNTPVALHHKDQIRLSRMDGPRFAWVDLSGDLTNQLFEGLNGSIDRDTAKEVLENCGWSIQQAVDLFSFSDSRLKPILDHGHRQDTKLEQFSPVKLGQTPQIERLKSARKLEESKIQPEQSGPHQAQLQAEVHVKQISANLSQNEESCPSPHDLQNALQNALQNSPQNALQNSVQNSVQNSLQNSVQISQHSDNTKNNNNLNIQSNCNNSNSEQSNINNTSIVDKIEIDLTLEDEDPINSVQPNQIPSSARPNLVVTLKKQKTEAPSYLQRPPPTCDSGILQNWIPKLENPGKRFSFVQIFAPAQELKTIFLTTYVVHFQWVLSELKSIGADKLPIVIVHGNPLITPESANAPSNLHVHCPKMPFSFGVNHGKIFLLRFEKFVRVVVSTANLIHIDYERKAQGIWYQDFYPKQDKTKSSGDFEETLVDYVHHLTKDCPFTMDLSAFRNYDYSTAKVHLITSVAGTHKGNFKQKYGLGKVQKIMESKKATPLPNSYVVAQGSSIGSLSENWISNQFLKTFQVTNSQNLKVIWPTRQFVTNCIDGIEAGGSLLLAKKNLKPEIEKRLFLYDDPIRKNVLIPPHIKTYLCVSPSDKKVSWFYLTSSNFSKAAHGELQNNGGQFKILNNEVGVLFLPQDFGHDFFALTDLQAMLPYEFVDLQVNKDPWFHNL